MDYQAIIDKYYPEDDALRTILITHSQSVAQKALQIVSLHPELNADRQFVEEAAMLHDIGIFKCDAPGKDVVFGPAYLVVADVPLPLAIPYGFFPFSKSYSSGFIMPTYGDENSRGFYLRDGGYYFALSDKCDLKLLGEIYTKGSWGLSAASNYRKRYKFSGSFYFSYQDTKTGDKGMPDFQEQKSFKLQWSHRQDAKANPFSTLSASVNFASTSYERNNLNSLYNPQTMTQSTRTSSVSWSTTFSSIGLSLSSTANLSQNMRDSSIAMTLPDLNISRSRCVLLKNLSA
jgi:lipopolysaccharide assembly outer membrane protein LptD (OstA)